MKRKIIVFTILAIFCVMNISAQNANRQRLDAYKIALFTKRLNLTSQEAEKFWPVYNQYQDNKNQIQLERHEINRNFNQNELNMSEREMTEAGDKFVDLEVREAALAQEFHTRIKTILSPVKILRLYQAENQFRQQLLNELRDRNQVRNNQNIRQQ
jgi:hypothetical protein